MKHYCLHCGKELEEEPWAYYFGTIIRQCKTEHFRNKDVV